MACPGRATLMMRAAPSPTSSRFAGTGRPRCPLPCACTCASSFKKNWAAQKLQQGICRIETKYPCLGMPTTHCPRSAPSATFGISLKKRSTACAPVWPSPAPFSQKFCLWRKACRNTLPYRISNASWTTCSTSLFSDRCIQRREARKTICELPVTLGEARQRVRLLNTLVAIGPDSGKVQSRMANMPLVQTAQILRSAPEKETTMRAALRGTVWARSVYMDVGFALAVLTSSPVAAFWLERLRVGLPAWAAGFSGGRA